jgi:hypothetical protein
LEEPGMAIDFLVSGGKQARILDFSVKFPNFLMFVYERSQKHPKAH